MSLTTVLDQLKDARAYPNSSYSKLPTVLQLLVDAFAGHPFQEKAWLEHVFWNNDAFYGPPFTWLGVRDNEFELELTEYRYDAFLEWTVVAVAGPSVFLQAWKTVMVESPLGNGEFATPVPVPPPRGGRGRPKNVIEREVVEEIQENGDCAYWIVLRDAVDSAGGGPNRDDQLMCCPEERLVVEVVEGDRLVNSIDPFE